MAANDPDRGPLLPGWGRTVLWGCVLGGASLSPSLPKPQVSRAGASWPAACGLAQGQSTRNSTANDSSGTLSLDGVSFLEVRHCLMTGEASGP